MQERILLRAVDCIVEKGLQRTSTHDIARAARVSRGALLHHYPTRTSLLEAAYSRLLEQEVMLIDDFAATLSRDGSSLCNLIAFIRERYAGPLFKVTLDYLSLARVDDEIMQAVVPGSSRYISNLNALWDKCLAEIPIGSDRKRSLMNQTMLIVRGSAFQNTWRQDDAYFDQVMTEWTEQLTRQLSVERDAAALNAVAPENDK